MNYKAKAKDSFRTKFTIYRFKHIVSPDTAPLDFEFFKRYEIETELVRQHTSQYWQRLRDFKIGDKQIKDIEGDILKFKEEHKDLMRDWESRYVTEVFPFTFPKAEFLRISRVKECSYCHITVDEINLLIDNGLINKKRLRGYNLEMDRRNSNYEYSPANCVMCCYWCNNAKTDEFDDTEYQPIGDAMRQVWDARLSRLKS